MQVMLNLEQQEYHPQGIHSHLEFHELLIQLILKVPRHLPDLACLRKQQC